MLPNCELGPIFGHETEQWLTNNFALSNSLAYQMCIIHIFFFAASELKRKRLDDEATPEKKTKTEEVS